MPYSVARSKLAWLRDVPTPTFNLLAALVKLRATAAGSYAG